MVVEVRRGQTAARPEARDGREARGPYFEVPWPTLHEFLKQIAPAKRVEPLSDTPGTLKPHAAVCRSPATAARTIIDPSCPPL